MKTLRKVFLFLALVDFAVTIFLFKLNLDIHMFILGLGFILLGVSSIFEMIVVEKEENKVNFSLRKGIFVFLLCGFALCFCYFL